MDDQFKYLRLLLRDIIELLPGIKKISRKPIVLDVHLLSGAFKANYRLPKKFTTTRQHNSVFSSLIKQSELPLIEYFVECDKVGPVSTRIQKITPCEKGHLHPPSAINLISALPL